MSGLGRRRVSADPEKYNDVTSDDFLDIAAQHEDFLEINMAMMSPE